MTRFFLRPRAGADLAEIWRFTAQRWSVEQADRYYRQIVQTFDTLAERPTLGRICDDIRVGYRRHSVGAHVIFYRFAGEEIDIVRVLHSRRDFRRHLPRK